MKQCPKCDSRATKNLKKQETIDSKKLRVPYLIKQPTTYDGWVMLMCTKCKYKEFINTKEA